MVQNWTTYPTPQPVGTVPIGVPDTAPQDVLRFSIQPYISTVPGPRLTTYDIFPKALGIRVENYTVNTVIVVFGSAGAADVLRSHDLLVPPYSVATRSFSGSMVTVAQLPDLAALAAPGGQGCKFTFSATPQPEQLAQLPQMGPDQTAQPRPPTQYTAEAARVYTSRQWSLAPSSTGYASQFTPGATAATWPPNAITGVDIWLDASSPGPCTFSVTPIRGSASLLVPVPSGELSVADAIILQPGAYLGLGLTLDTNSDIYIQTGALAGTYSGQVLIKGW